MLRINTINRLGAYVERCSGTAYSELPSAIHNDLTSQMINWTLDRITLKSGAAVLDIGSGGGEALHIFKQKGYTPIGTNLHLDDVRMVLDRGLDCLKGDFHDITELVGSHRYDLVWARHSLEHSPIPGFMIEELFNVLKPGGYLYAEVPAPQTPTLHCKNRNHHAVLTPDMWESLFERANFRIVDSVCMNLETPLGLDHYFAWLVQSRIPS